MIMVIIVIVLTVIIIQFANLLPHITASIDQHVTDTG